MRLIALLLILCAGVVADDIYAKSGSSPMVKDVMIVERTGDRIFYLDKRLKRRGLSTSMVGRVERRRSTIHEFKEREAAAKDADALMQLAGWAAKKGFHREVVRSLWEGARKLDANHEAANLALGRVRHKGAWMTPAERQQALVDEEAAGMRAKGLVRYKDRWVTPDDKANLERGLVRHEGSWMTPDQVKEAQGYVRYEGKWVKREDLEVARLLGPARKVTGLGEKLRLVQTEHVAVMGDLKADKLADLSKTMERLFSEWFRLFPQAKGTDLLAGKYRLYVFRKARPYQKLVKALFKKDREQYQWTGRTLKIEQARMKARLKETSFWEFDPAPMSAHVQMPDPYEGLKAHCIHFAANVLACRHVRSGFPTWWLNEGLAYLFEKKITGTIQTFNVDVGAAGGYADQGSLDGENKNPWIDSTKWKGLLLNMVRAGRDPQLESIKGKQLFGTRNRMDHRDIAKAYSVVVFLARDDPRKFAEFFRDVKKASSGPSRAVEAEVPAVLKHYKNYREIEKRWKAYALNNFRIP